MNLTSVTITNLELA